MTLSRAARLAPQEPPDRDKTPTIKTSQGLDTDTRLKIQLRKKHEQLKLDYYSNLDDS